MRTPSPIARLTDIIEAVELIRSEIAGVTLDALEAGASVGWSSAALKSSPKRAGI